MKTVIPLRRTVKAVARGVGLIDNEQMRFKTTVHEDNAGALTLSQLEPGRMTPQSKHYAVKYHWFRSHLKENETTIQKIDTKDQKADIFTKGLRKDQFESIRKLLCGW